MSGNPTLPSLYEVMEQREKYSIDKDKLKEENEKLHKTMFELWSEKEELELNFKNFAIWRKEEEVKIKVENEKLKKENEELTRKKEKYLTQVQELEDKNNKYYDLNQVMVKDKMEVVKENEKYTRWLRRFISGCLEDMGDDLIEEISEDTRFKWNVEENGCC